MSLLDNILLRWRPRNFAILGLHIEQGYTRPFAFVWVKQKDGQLHVSELDGTLPATLDGCVELLKNTPVIIQVEGPEVVHRMQADQQWEVQEELQQQHYLGEPFAAVMHQTAYDVLLETLIDFKLQLLGVYLGCSGLAALQTQPPQQQVGHYCWADVPYYLEPTDTAIHYGEEATTPRAVSLYMRALWYAAAEPERQWHTAWAASRMQQQIMRVGMPIVLFILLINFLLYQPMYNELAALQSTANSAAFRGWEEQKAAQEQQRAFIARNTVTDPGVLSWQLDELLRQMPREISLTAIDQNYVRVAPRPGKAPVQEENRLRLAGIVRENAALGNWMQVIDTLAWVRATTLADFSGEQNGARFILEVDTQPEFGQP